MRYKHTSKHCCPAPQVVKKKKIRQVPAKSHLSKVLAEESQGTLSQASSPQVSGPVVQAYAVRRVHAGLHVALTQPEVMGAKTKTLLVFLSFFLSSLITAFLPLSLYVLLSLSSSTTA